MKTTKFIPLLEEALKDHVSEILMFGTPDGGATAGTRVFFKYAQGHSLAYKQDIAFLDLQNFARGLKPSPHGSFTIGKNHITYQVEMTAETTQIHLGLKYPVTVAAVGATGELDVTAHALESILKPGAFSIVSGSRFSGRTRLLEQILNHSLKRKKLVTCLCDEVEFDLPKDVRFWTRQENKAVPHYLFTGADVVLVDMKAHVPADELLKCAERGLSVVLVLNAPHVVAGILRCLSLFKANLARERFSQVFEGGVGVYAVQSAASENLEFVNENYLMTQSLREDLLAGRFEGLMKGRAFNQTLLQYLLKRKIDLKAGFQLSPDPEQLDSMLKKIGF